jgi:hypothetical protein
MGGLHETPSRNKVADVLRQLDRKEPAIPLDCTTASVNIVPRN